TSGDYKDGVYTVTIPGEDMEEGSLTYKWTVNDFGNNEDSSDEYVVDVKAGITVGYTEDFEQKPMGWTSFGEENRDRKSTRLNSSHVSIAYAVFCLQKKNPRRSLREL